MYTQKSQIQNYLMINIADSFDSQINKWIEAVSNWIDGYTGKKFEQESATEKLYDGDGSKELLISDLLTLTKIETLDFDGDVDETVDDSSEYYLYPSNDTPKSSIVLNPSNSPIACFPSGNQNIKITGTFGHSATVPEDIRLVATKLVAGIIEEKNYSLAGVVKSEKIGQYTITLADIDKVANHLGIKEMLKRHRNIPLGVA